MPQIILASQSARRKKLLQQIGLTFSVIPSHAEEISTAQHPAKIVEELALLKALDVASKHPGSLTIGADTVVVLNNEIIGKPKDNDQARSFLRRLSGSQHLVYTGMALVKTGKSGHIDARHTFYEQTKVTFGTLEEHEIESYIKHENPSDKAGAYGIQDSIGALFVKKIDGDYYNVVGLPLHRFYQEMKLFMPNLNILHP